MKIVLHFADFNALPWSKTGHTLQPNQPMDRAASLAFSNLLARIKTVETVTKVSINNK